VCWKLNCHVLMLMSAGCGKTSLLKFLADAAGVQLSVLNVHGGTSSRDILQAVDAAESTAALHPGRQASRAVLLLLCCCVFHAEAASVVAALGGKFTAKAHVISANPPLPPSKHWT
jgi:ABC-type nitrate/sulfonate/bicarbonate transport system ATPase subunit